MLVSLPYGDSSRFEVAADHLLASFVESAPSAAIRP